MKNFDDETAQATAYCTYCPKLCRFSCPVAEAEGRETVTPWGLMRLLEFSRTRDVTLTQEVAETFMHCTGCGRCETWCNHDNDVPKAMWAARAWAHEQGVSPEVTHQLKHTFATHAAPHALPPFPRDLQRECFDEAASRVFFPACHTRKDPEKLARIGLLLERLLGERVRLVTRTGGAGPGCCGSPLLAAGDVPGWKRHHDTLMSALADASEVITDCPSMAATWRSPDRWGATFAEPLPPLRHMVEVLDELVPLHPPAARLEKQGAMLLEGCLSARHLGHSDAIRRVLAMIFDERPDDLSQCRDQETCCGAHGLYPLSAPRGSRRCATELMAQLGREGAEAVVCGSPQCAQWLRAVNEDEDAAIDLLDAACLAYELELE